MQLSYRGTAYEAQNPAIELIETGTDRLGLFLGQRFKMKQINVTQRYAPPKHLTYRGVHYDQTNAPQCEASPKYLTYRGVRYQR